MQKFTDHALCDIELTQYEIYKIRLCVDRELESLSKSLELAVKYNLPHDVEDHLITRYLKIKAKLGHTEKFWLDRGSFHIRFVYDRGFDHE